MIRNREESSRKRKEYQCYEKAIVKYLVEISQQNVSTKDQQTIDELFSTANDIERIGDHRKHCGLSLNQLSNEKSS